MRLVQREAQPPFLSICWTRETLSTVRRGGGGSDLPNCTQGEWSEVWRDWEWDTDTQPVKPLTLASFPGLENFFTSDVLAIPLSGKESHKDIKKISITD